MDGDKISLDQYIILKDIWQNADSVTEEDFDLQMIELFPNSPELYDHFIRHNKCPDCGGKLELQTDDCDIYEYQGQRITKDNFILVCEDCNAKYDDRN